MTLPLAPKPDTPKTGTRVLIVEDEPMVALAAEEMIDSLGCIVAASAATLAEALAVVAAGEFDVALLDINLKGTPSLPVATALRKTGKPFLLTTGYGSAGPTAEYGDVPLLAKPYRVAALGAAIAALLDD
ncbi:response regulator [Sphingomonas oleivorans]|uniref:Response regulator n=1 Tax=Sphingomonas oleivorans TaxID=1735121 RepID=A0A2T5G0I4_9SPHN|nr:response regulator [Sphingomonas oleivorans]PTQ12643.1 response regulator [Sphingomonas oleivorans]